MQPIVMPLIKTKKRFESTNVVDYYQKKADKIKHDNINNFKYVYWMKTPNGMRLNETYNHKYGDSRKGYELWKTDNQNLVVSYGGNVSLRGIRERKSNHLIGYITEEKLSDESWKKEIMDLTDECFETLCEELDVKDTDTFEYFIYENMFDDVAYDLESKLEIMVSVYNKYKTDDDYRKLIDKIKG